jgi:hypothetical protein
MGVTDAAAQGYETGPMEPGLGGISGESDMSDDEDFGLGPDDDVDEASQKLICGDQLPVVSIHVKPGKTKRCKCGSTEHVRTSHMNCPLNTKRPRREGR